MFSRLTRFILVNGTAAFTYCSSWFFSDFCRAHEFRDCCLFYFVATFRSTIYRRIMCQTLLSKGFSYETSSTESLFVSFPHSLLWQWWWQQYVLFHMFILQLLPSRKGLYGLATWIWLSEVVTLCNFLC